MPINIFHPTSIKVKQTDDLSLKRPAFFFPFTTLEAVGLLNNMTFLVKTLFAFGFDAADADEVLELRQPHDVQLVSRDLDLAV